MSTFLIASLATVVIAVLLYASPFGANVRAWVNTKLFKDDNEAE